MENEQEVLKLLFKTTKGEINALLKFATTACESRNLAELALLLGAEISTLEKVFLVDDLDLLKFLCSKATKEQFESYKAGEALCWACRQNKVKKVELLLSYGIDPNKARLERPNLEKAYYCNEHVTDEDYFSCTPLEASIFQKNEELVGILINAGMKATPWDLSIATRVRAPEKIMELLIDSIDSIGIGRIGLTDTVNGLIWVLCKQGYSDALLKLFFKFNQEDAIKLVDFCVNWATHLDHLDLVIHREAAEKVIDIITTACKVPLTQEQYEAVCDFQKRVKEYDEWHKRIRYSTNEPIGLTKSDSKRIAWRKSHPGWHQVP